jgi:phosphoribosyl-AMP cyclohydrolase
MLGAKWYIGRIDTTLATAACRARTGLHRAFATKALNSPPARNALAGFLFLGAAVKLAFEKMDGLIPAVIQDLTTKDVLMLGFVDENALERTQRSGEVHFFSRSRNRLWKKGETSGHVLRVKEILVDCDADAVLIRVEAPGPGVCHEGYRACFFRELEADGSLRVIARKTFSETEVYGRKESA